jgi:UPF0755 protein
MIWQREHTLWALAFAIAVVIVTGYELTIAPPRDSVPDTIIRITSGSALPEIADELKAAHVIAHPILLRALLKLAGEGDSVQTGVYKFETPQNLFRVAYRIVSGSYGIPPARLTFVEGVTIRQMGDQVAEALPGVPSDDFRTAAEGKEGYLFPDTYFFQPGVDAAAVVDTLRANFDTRIAPLMSDIAASGHTLSEIVTLASLVEKEARTSADKRIVAGILWNRLRLGMPLQVDAVFGYIFGRDTYSPSPADLQVKSPYNTYTHTGLPPTPIDNPGLDSIEAALYPTKTSYLYYLTGTDGLMHYAASYAGHQTNLRKYLQ